MSISKLTDTPTAEDSKPAKIESSGIDRIPFDSAVWQMQDTGDFIHTKTGEVRDEDGFLSAAEDPDSEASAVDWDDIGDYTASHGDDGGGSHGFDDSAQVRPTRSAAAGTGDERPSKLSAKKRK